MRPDRYSEWLRRYVGRQLGLGDELWAFPENYPGFDRLREILVKSGRPATEDLTYWASRTLIHDLIDAAGAVEYAVQRLETTFADAQMWVTANVPLRGAGQPRPQLGEWASAPDVRYAYLDFNNAIIWVRGLQERMDRGAGSPRIPNLFRRLPLLKRLLRSRPRAGLANVLAAGQLRDDVRKAHAAFLKRTREVRLLANFGLHASRIQQNAGTAAAEVLDDQTIVLRIPDRVTRPVAVFDEFSFEQGRDAITYANDLLAAVDELIDAVLDAFERARPPRFGP